MKELRDVSLKLSRALPNGAANVTTATSIDTGKTTTQGQAPAAAELLLSAPAMTTSQMPDAKTMIYDLIESANADLSSPSTRVAAALTQTGAASAGCAAATYRFRLPTDGKRYWGFKATGSATGDSTGATATLELLV